ncbi:MAG: hypothetical protein JXQ90_00405 [Cyclobacteriaceae bacterium]
MNIEKLNNAFVAIVEKKAELKNIPITDSSRGPQELTLMEMENMFMREYGAFIEEALFNVHDEYCPDNDVLLPVAYFASDYLKKGIEGAHQYDVSNEEGILVQADDFPGVEARLVLCPNPTRLILQGKKEMFREIVWVAREVA